MHAYPYGQQNSQPLGNQIGQGVAGTLMGMGQGMTQNANQVANDAWQRRMYEQNQQSQNDFRNMWARNQGPIQTGMSGQTTQPQQGPVDDLSRVYSNAWI
jgi:hypothetical protein